MNIYEVSISSLCPINGRPVDLHIRLETQNVVMVETLLSFLEDIKNNLHEELADKLYKKFGGKQVVKGFHHGVWITTERG